MLVVCDLMFVVPYILIFIKYSMLVISAGGYVLVPEDNRRPTFGCFSADLIIYGLFVVRTVLDLTSLISV